MASSSRINSSLRAAPSDNENHHSLNPSANASQSITMGHLLRLARVVGYGLLLLSFVDFLYVLIPADFMDPVWEYQFAGDLVKLVPVPLLTRRSSPASTAPNCAPTNLSRNSLSWRRQ